MKNKKINYKNTINLPDNKFPMRGNLTNKEPKIIKEWIKKNIYNKIKNKNKKNKKFIIHDGPPFANGKIHLGHSLNKIIKDIILKYKILNNYNISYIPGWDCHGLPIELEIQKKKNIKLNNIKNIKKFKKKCKKYIKKQINIQKKEFIRLGIFANWNNYYKTSNYKTISNTIKILNKLIKKKLIIRDKKPINWCINCKSSLSESEIEYKKIKSNSLYIYFKLHKKKKIINKLNIKNKNKYKNIKLIIWTTTPWTIPENNAISINNKYKYLLIGNKNNIFIILKNRSKNICKKLNIKLNIIKEIKGKELINKKYYHPISKKKLYIVNNKYIDKKIGTGIVHLSKKHGEQDFEICKINKIKGKNIINKNGKFNKYKFIKELKNKKIEKGIKIIIKNIKKYILLKENIIHKSPICWRHKSKTIIRSTQQWFIKLNKKLKKKLILNIKKIKWRPKWGYNKIKKMIIERPNWCISRQRFWGTPITILINKKNKKIHPNTYNLIKKISKKIEKYGPNYWLDIKIKKLIKEYKNYKKVKDILDVWFESGSTIFTINKKINNIDLIIEGHDQYRGWFMSSLIINTALNKKIKYKKIVSHGFILDKNGNKMSKSLKNYIEPKQIINKYGSDIIRLWISCNNFYKNINISNEIILRTIELYRKIRNTFKFIISNLNEYNNKINFIKKKKMILIDKWIIYKANKYNKNIKNLFEKLKFYKIIKKINKFFNYYLSSIYFDIIKDRKYIIKKNTTPVNSVQTTLYILLQITIKWITPIIPFTSEEIWKFLNKKKCIYLTKKNKKNKFKINKKEIHKNIWNKLLLIKNKFNKIIENKKEKKIIKTSLETKIIIYINNKFYNKIKIMKSELKFFFITSKLKIIKINNINNFFFKIKCKKYNGKKCLRCWHYNKFLINNKICKRCFKNINKNGEIRKFI